MTKKAQILVNGHDVRQSTALSGSGKAMDSHNAVKQGFPAGKCAINTQNQADFVYLIMQNKLVLSSVEWTQFPNGPNECKHLFNKGL
ncbi:MAG TPA: hypothetical protein VMX36_07825 [Sedimentisphaerales bacterium]|nr:hypothetical protein [Sedimentisphaerales bacterium]